MSTQERDVLALEAKVEHLQCDTKNGKETSSEKSQKNDAGTAHKAKPIESEWLVENVAPKDNAQKKYCMWNNAKWYWCAEE